MLFGAGNKLVDSSLQYAYDTRTRTYVQSVYSGRILTLLQDANSERLSALKTTRAYDMEKLDAIPAQTSLSDLINFGLENKPLIPRVFSAVMDELSQQTQ